MKLDALQHAVTQLMSAALAGDGWAQALENLAQAADAGGATLIRFRGDRPLTHVSSAGWAEADADLLAGRAPPSPRRFFPQRALGRGFVLDADLFTDTELRRDPYYQEFLRPRGVFWHAKSQLYTDAGERVTLSLKRYVQRGPYERDDVTVLDSVLPDLGAAMRIGRRVLDAETLGMARAIHRRGDPVIEIDAWGRVLRIHADAERFPGIVVSERRLMAEDPMRQTAFDRALQKALAAPPRATAIILAERETARTLLQLVPIGGPARNLFGIAAAIAVVVDVPSAPRLHLRTGMLIDAFGLTQREAQVATLLAQGTSPARIAMRLNVQVGTVRNQMKSVFEKSGTNRQGELIALLSRLEC